MKKCILPCLLLAASLATAQPTIQWQKTYGGSFANNDTRDLALTGDGGYILAGTLNFVDALLVKLDAAGNTVWKKTYGGTGTDEFFSVQQTSDGGYIAAGTTNSVDGDVSGLHNEANAKSDIWVVKLDAAGNITWQKCLGGTQYDAANAIQQTADGGYIVTGSSNSDDGSITGHHGGGDCVVIKLSSAGGIVWAKALGGTQGEVGYSIVQTNDNGYIIAASSYSNNGDVTGHHGDTNYNNEDYWIVKLDATGNITWQKSIGGTRFDRPQSVRQTSDNGYIISGKSVSTDGDVTGNHGGFDYWVIKTDASGTIIWQKSLGGSAEDDGFGIELTSEGGYIVCGKSLSNDGDVSGHNLPISYPDAWVVKLTSAGAITWQKCLGGTATDYGYAIKETGSGFAMLGAYGSRGNAGDYWLVQLNASGNITMQVTEGASGGEDYAYSSQQTSDGGYIIAGNSTSNNQDVSGNHGGNDIWVVKTSSTGTIEWQKSIGGGKEEIASMIRQTSDGGYIIAGQTYSNDGDASGNHGAGDAWVIKLTSTGNITWKKCYGGSDYEIGIDIAQTTDGGYVLAAQSSSNNGDISGNHGQRDYWIVKLDANGSISWQKCLGGTSQDYVRAIKQTSDGGYIVAGVVYSNDGDVTGNHGAFDFWMVKLNDAGNIDWKKCMGGTAGDEVRDVQQTSDGGYILAGVSSSNDGDVTGNHGGVDYWIVKVDAAGAITWQKSFGGTASDFALSVKQTSDGGYVVAGYENSTDADVTGNHGGYDYWLIKLDNLGTLLWQKTLGGTSHDYATSMQVTSDEGFYISGYTMSNNGDVSNNHQSYTYYGFYDYWSVKLSPTGSLPLTLLSFNARKQQSDIITQWQTTSEFNVSHFELQRSSNAINYSSIANIKATNNSTINNYFFTDVNATLSNKGKKWYYRLKIIDHDAAFKFSKVAVIDIPASSTISIYPNPAHDFIKLNTAQSLTGVQVLNSAGKWVKQFVPNPGNSYGISDLTNGIYILRLLSNEGQTILKFEKQ